MIETHLKEFMQCQDLCSNPGVCIYIKDMETQPNILFIVCTDNLTLLRLVSFLCAMLLHSTYGLFPSSNVELSYERMTWFL